MIYFAVLRYVGTAFCGFQVQRGRRTVQGVLNEAAASLFGCPCLITGCSRTDSGVHAERFCLTLEPTEETAARVPPAALPRAILPYLPPDVSLTFAAQAPGGFHARYAVLKKEYRYRLRFGGMPDPFLVGRVWQQPYPLGEAAYQRMCEVTPHFVGKHDFSAFMCTDAKVTDTVREIFSLTLTREGNEACLSVSGNGFLYNMVRIIAGTLFEVAMGKRSAEEIPAILKSRDRCRAGMTAPPDGLYLHDVIYKPPFQKLLFGE